MLIALLAILGVDLWVILALLAAVLLRRWHVSRQPGAFRGAIRVVEGDVPGLKAKWKRGYGRWVRDVLVWTNAPLCIRYQFVPASGLAGEARPIKDGEVRRLGKQPSSVLLLADSGARVEVAAPATRQELACGPFNRTLETVGRHGYSDLQPPAGLAVEATELNEDSA